MRTSFYGFCCALFFLFAGCVGVIEQKPVHALTEFTLSPQHRTEGLFTLVSIERDGRVRARIFHRIYSARVGDWFMTSDSASPSEYLLKSVDQATGQVVVQSEARL